MACLKHSSETREPRPGTTGARLRTREARPAATAASPPAIRARRADGRHPALERHTVISSLVRLTRVIGPLTDIGPHVLACSSAEKSTFFAGPTKMALGSRGTIQQICERFLTYRVFHVLRIVRRPTQLC